MYFSHMTYLMSYVTSLNNTCGWSYKLSHRELQQIGYKPVCSQTLSQLICTGLVINIKTTETQDINNFVTDTNRNTLYSPQDATTIIPTSTDFVWFNSLSTSSTTTYVTYHRFTQRKNRILCRNIDTLFRSFIPDKKQKLI